MDGYNVHNTLTFTLEGDCGYAPGFVRLTSGCDIRIPAIGVGVLKLLPVLFAVETGKQRIFIK